MIHSAKVALTVALACVFSLLSGWVTDSAVAHGVIVFAWAEGDKVYVEGKFAGGRKINGGEVTVENSQGTVLLRGRTDDQGRFAFSAPVKADLKIIVQAGTGHRGEWTVSASEFSPTGHDGKQRLPGPAPAANHLIVDDQTNPQSVYTAADLAAIEAAVEKALDRKLEPVIQMFVDTRPGGPSLKDILGGIGYILGLVGVGAYIHSRNKS